MKKISEIQYITRDDKQYSHAAQVKMMFQTGIDWVQLRMKKASEEVIVLQAREAMEYVRKYNGKLIINDHIEIAKEVGAHGVHLGLLDTPVNKAREQLGEEAIIGGTANSLEDIERQVSLGADYVGLGPCRFTKTKEILSPEIGWEGYIKIMEQFKNMKIDIPVIAVGGIETNELINIKRFGLYGAALSKSLFENRIQLFAKKAKTEN